MTDSTALIVLMVLVIAVYYSILIPGAPRFYGRLIWRATHRWGWPPPLWDELADRRRVREAGK